MSYLPYKVQIQAVRENRPRKSFIITNADDVWNLLHEESLKWDREKFLCIVVDTKNKVLGINEVAVGSMEEAIVHPREVFKPMVLMSGSGLIIVHNHPSGDPTPSNSDRAVTNRIKKGCEVLGFRFLDSIVMGDETYVSILCSGSNPELAM